MHLQACLAQAAVFSYALTVNGIDIPHFTDLSIKYDVSGYGESGVISVQFSFSVPACEYEDSVAVFPSEAVVILTCSNMLFSVPQFYITSRSHSGGRINFVCCDRTYTVDREILLSEDAFDSDGYISVTELLGHIMSVCGFSGYSDTSGMLGSVITRAHKDNVYERKCRGVLDDLSAACVGFWTVQGDEGTAEMRGTLALIALGGGCYGSMFTAEKYTALQYGGVRKFAKIVVSSGDKSYTSGSAGNVFGVLEIETPYASAAVAGALYDRLKDYTYKAWECDKMLTDIYPAPSSMITFGSRTDMYANHCSLSLTSSGIYASVGRNAVSEDEVGYVNRTTRAIRQRYRLGDIMSNVQISQNGINYVFQDDVNNKTEKYGFTVSSGGVTEYDGAMLSNVQPSGQFITSSDGKDIVRANYGGKLYDYECTENEDGTFILIKNEVTASG